MGWNPVKLCSYLLVVPPVTLISYKPTAKRSYSANKPKHLRRRNKSSTLYYGLPLTRHCSREDNKVTNIISNSLLIPTYVGLALSGHEWIAIGFDATKINSLAMINTKSQETSDAELPGPGSSVTDLSVSQGTSIDEK